MIHQYEPYIDISLDNLLHNVNEIKSRLLPHLKIIAVVKDNAYGCGAALISKTLENKGGIDSFAVSNAKEAFFLRERKIKSNILVMGKATEEELTEGLAKNITFTCNDLQDFYRWKNINIPIQFHCKIDTGMTRLGIKPEEIDVLINELPNATHLKFKGIFTHLASADIVGTNTVEKQHSLFERVISKLNSEGIKLEYIHIANSAGVLRFPPFPYTHVRVGISLYGCRPDPSQDFNVNLLPVFSLKGHVVSIRKVPSGTSVSYGGTYVTKKETHIATVSIGYAQGLPRYLSNKGEMLIKGRRYPIAGRVTMDYTMLDIGNEDVKIGDEVVAIGRQGDEIITPDEVALHGNTIAYEVLCNSGKSVKRRYWLENSIVEEEEGFIF
ncbi:MAG: alanine racemase [Chitinispirillaceae bacterium]|nr:alanine racemase [Chitinispirillaceae bacterium]